MPELAGYVLDGLAPAGGLAMAALNGAQLCLCTCDGGGTGGVAAVAPSVLPIIEDTTESELGVDFDVVTDIDPNFRLASGRKNLANAIARRLYTPGGFLFDAWGGDPNYGVDIRGKLNAGFTLDEIAGLESRIQSEVEKDERVQAADVSVVYVLAEYRLDVTLNLETAAGPFRLILKVSDLKVEMLAVEAI